MGKIPNDNNSYDGVLGDEYPGYSFFQTSHDFSKKLDEFEVGEKSRILAWIDSNDELIKQITYNIYFEKVDNEKIWIISDFEKRVKCRYDKNEFGECVGLNVENKIDISGTKFKRGQYKVLLKEVDENSAQLKTDLAARRDTKKYYSNTIEVILNIGDGASGSYSYYPWGSHSLTCKFSNGKILNENTILFPLECISEGNKYDEGNYTIEIIDDTRLRWKSNDGRLTKTFNYTFVAFAQ